MNWPALVIAICCLCGWSCWFAERLAAFEAKAKLRQLMEARKQLDAAKPRWRRERPDDQCWWWGWNGDDDCDPVPVNVMFSGTDGTYFVSAGQLGFDTARPLSDFDGWWWQKAVEPDTAAILAAKGEQP